MAARTIPVDLAALAVGGAVTLAATGLLAYLMRHALASLRPHLGQRGPADHVRADAHDAEPGRGEDAARPRQAAGQPPELRAASPRSRNSTTPLPAVRDITEPLPVYRESVLACREPAGRLPVYQATVVSLRWDPAGGQRSDTN